MNKPSYKPRLSDPRRERPQTSRPGGRPYRKPKPGQEQPASGNRFRNGEREQSGDSPSFAHGPEQDERPAPENARNDESLLPGLKPVLELLETSPEKIDAVFLRKGRHVKDMDRIADLCRQSGVRFSLLEQPVFGRLYSGSSQGVVARLFEAGYQDYDVVLDNIMEAPLPLLVALDQVQDPGNAGTLARTLYAMGGAGLVVPRHNGVYLGAAAAKASAGALEKLPVAKVANLGQAIDSAKERGITIYGAAAGAENRDEVPGTIKSNRNATEQLDVFHFTPRLPAVLILGSEEDGMRQSLEKRCDAFITIPMLRQFDSLNVAQAGAVIISSFARGALEKASSKAR